MGDHGAGLGQGLQDPGLQGLAVDLAAGGCHDHLDEGRDLFTPENVRSGGQVLQAAVGAGTQEDLVHSQTRDLADGVDVVHLRGTCGDGDEVLRPVGEDTLIGSVWVALETLQEGVVFKVLRGDTAVLGGLLIGGEEAALGAALDGHVGHGHAAGD